MKSPPREKGFTAGLWSKPIDSNPSDYTVAQVAQFRAGWRDGNEEATLRRKEAKRVARVGYHPETVAVKERNGKIVMYTLEQYSRRAERLKKHGVLE